MDQLILSMIDAIQSLKYDLAILEKECETANKNYIQQQHELQILVSKLHSSSNYQGKQEFHILEFGKWTSSSDYQGKHKPLVSKCQNLQRSFGMITQHAGELTGALHDYAENIEEFYKIDIVQTKKGNIDASPAPPLPEVAVEHNMAASENAVEHNMDACCDASEDAMEHTTWMYQKMEWSTARLRMHRTRVLPHHPTYLSPIYQ